MVNNMPTASLDYDIYCGRVYDELLNFDKEAFHAAFEFGVFKKLNIFEALEVAQAGHLNALDPWEAGTGYLGMFTDKVELLTSRGYEICPALAKFLPKDTAIRALIGNVGVRMAYYPMYHYFKTSTKKPRVRVKAHL